MERNIDKDTLAQLPTQELKEMLKNDCDGVAPLSTQTSLLICELLASREPLPKGAAKAAWKRFHANYWNM